ncbi:hypothetical protein F2Q70_00008572 [Brassica cretica]|uniref:Uncharacterized protein n=1 Tax=Brassica cretica TaxID=69181 RepID=A0A8S9M1D5_BRACR|nr:hypothetical protein F2Q70_00008572 [Brassica cretica]
MNSYTKYQDTYESEEPCEDVWSSISSLPSSSTIICAFSRASIVALDLAFSIFGIARTVASALLASSNLRASYILHSLC